MQRWMVDTDKGFMIPISPKAVSMKYPAQYWHQKFKAAIANHKYLNINSNKITELSEVREGCTMTNIIITGLQGIPFKYRQYSAVKPSEIKKSVFNFSKIRKKLDKSNKHLLRSVIKHTNFSTKISLKN